MWGYLEELVAQLIEEVSVLTADKRRKEPRRVPRPGASERTPESSVSGGDGERIVVRGHRGMLALAARKAGVTLPEGGGEAA